MLFANLHTVWSHLVVRREVLAEEKWKIQTCLRASLLAMATIGTSVSACSQMAPLCLCWRGKRPRPAGPVLAASSPFPTNVSVSFSFSQDWDRGSRGRAFWLLVGKPLTISERFLSIDLTCYSPLNSTLSSVQIDFFLNALYLCLYASLSLSVLYLKL